MSVLAPERQSFFGRFHAQRLLKADAEIETWLGQDGSDGPPVVIKATSRARLPQAIRLRLEHEARVLRSVECPYVPSVLESGCQGEDLALVMSFVPGEALRERLDRCSLSLAETLRVGVSLMHALAHVHAVGVLHRDVKPANVILRPDGSAALVDFGLARSSHLLPGLREVSAGTVLYMAPEQAGMLAADVDAAADLYSCGVVLYECLSGRCPFDGESITEVLRSHLTLTPPPLRALGLDLPPVMDEILQRMLRKDPRERYQTAAGVLADLQLVSAALERGEARPTLVVGAAEKRSTLAPPGFVGRERELRALEAAIEDARTGRGGVVLVGAPSGGGKSRLLAEIAVEAIRGGGRVFQGHAHEQQASLPFEMLADVVQDLDRQARLEPALREQVRIGVGGWAEAAVAALPELAQALGRSSRPLRGGEDSGELRTLRALQALLQSLGTEREPALVLLDDGQWADEMTLRLLQAWSVHIRENPTHTVVVVAFRDDEVEPGHPLTSLQPKRRLDLAPLGGQDVAALLGSMAGDLPADAVEMASRLAEGSPFMAVEILRGMVECGALAPDAGGWCVQPQAMQEVQFSRRAAAVMTRRLALLSPPVAELLTQVAVAGKEFDLDLAVALTGREASPVIDALDEARRRGVLWAGLRGTRFRFVHDRLRQEFLEGLDGPRRRELHRKTAEYLEERDPERLYELAYHFDQGGMPRKALPHAVAAAADARSRYALEVAEGHYRIALKTSTAAEGGPRLSIVEGLGDVLTLRGRYEEAKEQFRTARGLATDPVSRARLEGKLGDLHFRQGQVTEAGQLLGGALALLRMPVSPKPWRRRLSLLWEAGVQAMHTLFPGRFVGRRPAEGAEADLLAAYLYNRLAYAWWFSHGSPDLLWAHLRHLNLAERYPASPILSRAYADHGMALSNLPWFPRGYEYAERGLAMRKGMDDPLAQAHSNVYYGMVLYAGSRLAQAEGRLREAYGALEKTGDLWIFNVCRYSLALVLYRMGRLVEGRGYARESYQIGIEIGDPQATGIAIGALARVDPLGVTEALVEQDLQGVGDDHCTRAWLLEADGIRLLARGEVDRAVEVLERSWEVTVRIQRRNEYAASTPAWLTTALRMQAERTPAIQPDLRERRIRGARRMARIARSWGAHFRNNLAHALREDALVSALEGGPDRARKLLDESLGVSEELGMAYERALTLRSRARLGRSFGWAGAAEDEARARQELEGLGLDVLEEGGEAPADPGPPSLSLADRFSTVLVQGRRVVSVLTRDDVYRSLREAALALFRAEECVVLRIDPGTGPVAVAGEDGGGVSRTVIRDAVEGRRPVTVSEPHAQPIGRPSDSLILAGVRSVLAAPVLAGGEPVACLYVTHRLVGGLFGEEEERLAAFLTTLAGAALETVDGHEALRQDRERLYREELKVERLEVRRRTLAEFLGIASHDVRTLMSVSAMFAAQLRSGISPHQLEVCREVISTASLKAESLVRLYLDAAQTEVGKELTLHRAPFDLGALAREVVEFQVRCHRIETGGELSVDCFTEAVPVVGDRERVWQVVANLVGNALKFSGPDKSLQVQVRCDGGEAEVSVIDHGPGISEEDRVRIFEPFAHLGHQRTGSGLGLWIARIVVEAHAGSLGVESEPGRGSRFWFRLPLEPARAESPPRPSLAVAS